MRQAVIRKLTAVIQGKKAELKMQTKIVPRSNRTGLSGAS